MNKKFVDETRVVYLRTVLKLSYSSICDAMGISQYAVYTTLVKHNKIILKRRGRKDNVKQWRKALP